MTMNAIGPQEQRDIRDEKGDSKIDVWAVELAAMQERYNIVASEADRLNRELFRMKSSLSWKITGPLRKVEPIIRRIATGLIPGLAKGHQGLPTKDARITDLLEAHGDRPFLFNKPERPYVDVVVWSMGGSEGLSISLAGLASDPSRDEFQIHVLHDGSSELTDTLNRVRGAELVLVVQQRGVGEQLREYCRQLSAPYVVFVVGGCHPSAGCVKAMVDSLGGASANAAVSGAKVRDSLGRLGRCLGLYLENGEPSWVGLGDHPDRPPFRYTRKVDFVSPQCFSIARGSLADLDSIWDSWSAPEEFALKLAEETMARSLGVMFSPAADAVLFGSESEESRGPSSSNPRPNLSKQVSEIHSGPSCLAQSGPARNKGVVAIIDGTVPKYDQDSGSLRMYRLVVALKELGYHAVFLPVDNDLGGIYGEALERQGIEVICAPHDDFESWLARNGRNLTAVILSRIHVAHRFISRVKRLAPHARIAFDTVDLHFLREGRQAELLGDPDLLARAKKTRRRELAIAEQADVTLVVSDEEVKLLSATAPQLKVRVLTNIHEPEPSNVPFEDRRGILFVGGFAHEPNVDAVLFFVNEIFPIIKGQMPGAEFYCVGSWPTDEIKALATNKIHVTGFVPDLKPFFDRCKLSVAPLRYGAGVKGKINQSMALGLPVVGTSLACEGMWLTSGKDVLVADSPKEFADAVIRLYTDGELWQSISEAGLENIRKHFSTDAAKRALLGVIEGDVSES